MTVQENPLSEIAQRFFVGPVPDHANFSGYSEELEKICVGYLEGVASSDIDRAYTLFILYRCGLRCSEASKEELSRLIGGLNWDALDIGCLLKLALMSVTLEDEASSLRLIELCKKVLNFEYCVTGRLGYKSRHQEKAVAILVVDVISCTFVAAPEKQLPALPKSIDLEDDDLWDTPKFGDHVPVRVGNWECALLLVSALFVETFETRDDAALEKIDAYVRLVLESSTSWSILRMALYVRSSNEADRPKYTLRSLKQLESLLSEFVSPSPAFVERSQHADLLCLPDILTLTRRVATLGSLTGNFSRAAELYCSLGMPVEAAACLTSCGRKPEAIQLLRSDVAKSPLNYPSLCLLGDLTENSGLYREAWDLSNHKYMPALRSLGVSLLRGGQIGPSAECFSELVSRLPSSADNWFLLGCSLLGAEDWDKALDAFGHVIALDHDHFRAWNNLAAIHLRLGKLECAQHSLKMSARLEFDSWTIWDNLFKVSLQLGDFFECVFALQRLVEIKGKEVGLFPLFLLVEKLSDVDPETLDKLCKDSSVSYLLQSLDCLVSWHDGLFGSSADYITIKDEYRRLKTDLTATRR